MKMKIKDNGTEMESALRTVARLALIIYNQSYTFGYKLLKTDKAHFNFLWEFYKEEPRVRIHTFTLCSKTTEVKDKQRWILSLCESVNDNVEPLDIRGIHINVKKFYLSY
jgi:hypothetical protein